MGAFHQNNVQNAFTAHQGVFRTAENSFTFFKKTGMHVGLQCHGPMSQRHFWSFFIFLRLLFFWGAKETDTQHVNPQGIPSVASPVPFQSYGAWKRNSNSSSVHNLFLLWGAQERKRCPTTGTQGQTVLLDAKPCGHFLKTSQNHTALGCTVASTK